VGPSIVSDFQIRVSIEDGLIKQVPLMDALNISHLLHGLGYLSIKYQSFMPATQTVIFEALQRQEGFMNEKDIFGIVRGLALMGTQ
jgi:hypothetical protein